MKAWIQDVYEFFEAVPDRLYPFKVEVEGKVVRGRQAYARAVEDAWARYGVNNFGYKLSVYRGAFHFVGSVLFIIFAAIISEQLFNSEVALYILMGAAITALFYQEFVVHPRQYSQRRGKGIYDMLTWVVPMMIYLTLFR